MRDRAAQTFVRLALEPEWEARLEPIRSRRVQDEPDSYLVAVATKYYADAHSDKVWAAALVRRCPPPTYIYVAAWGRRGSSLQHQEKRFADRVAAERIYHARCREKELRGYQDVPMEEDFYGLRQLSRIIPELGVFDREEHADPDTPQRPDTDAVRLEAVEVIAHQILSFYRDDRLTRLDDPAHIRRLVASMNSRHIRALDPSKPVSLREATEALAAAWGFRTLASMG